MWVHIKKSETKDNILAPAIEESWAAKKRLILCDAKEVVEEIKERERDEVEVGVWVEKVSVKCLG